MAHAEVDWAVGSERISLCRSAWHPAMCAMLKPCVCVWYQIETTRICSTRAGLRSWGLLSVYHPTPRGPVTFSPNPRGPAGPPFPPSCCSALVGRASGYQNFAPEFHLASETVCMCSCCISNCLICHILITVLMLC